MIGALIGDLAAWTYENDKETFWKQLIPDQGIGAVPSIYGHALMKAASHNMLVCPWIDSTPIGTPYDGTSYYGQWLMWQIVDSWQDKEPSVFPPFSQIEKEEFYAKQFIKTLIGFLRKGYSKFQACSQDEMFMDLIQTWNWKTLSEKGDGLLSYVFRAWNSFYVAHDFTSTIHVAVKMPGDKHLTCAIAGAFADAMYGCKQNMIKQKYASGDTIHPFGMLMTGEFFDYHHALMMEMADFSSNRRSFWPKNCARTNAERHHWTATQTLFDTKVITKEIRRRIIKSFEPGWEDRYSFYLDDGWVYLCRSFVLVCRFKFIKLGNGSYRFRKIEKCDDISANEVNNALENALYSIEHHWSQLCRFDEIIEIEEMVAK